MRESKTVNLISGAMVGILMPAFLLMASTMPATAATTDAFAGLPAKIVYALVGEENPAPRYGIENSAFLFGGNGLPMTYSALATPDQMARLQADQAVAYAETDTVVRASQVEVNDPYFTTDQANGDMQWYLPRINMPRAWEHGTGSKRVKVAIIDTGIHATHLELNDGRVQAGFDAVVNRNIPADTNSDDNGHGTAVAGVIGAIADNQKGIAGINWDVGLIPVKALEANGTGNISTVSAGIIWAADHGADIINLSLGGPGFGKDQTLHNAIQHAYDKGALIISAAGNDLADEGISLDSHPVYPICADGGSNMVIGVAATDINDRKADFSNYGVACVDISAPGKKILTTAFLPSEPSDNILIYGSGTSLATPVVSGVAALLRANNPHLTNTEMRDIILRTSDNIDHLNQASCLGSSCNGFLGKGRINALSALSPQPLLDGALVRKRSSNEVYQIAGGHKRLVTDFVFRQRGFGSAQVLTEANRQLSDYSTEDPLPPMDNSLIKVQNEPTVYFMHQGQAHAVTYQVFLMRNFSFGDVEVISASDFESVDRDGLYWPPDGALLVATNNPTVYLMEDGVKRPVSSFVFNHRGYSFSQVVTVSTEEFRHIPNAPDKYWLAPRDNTLLKTASSPEVHLVLDGALRPLSAAAFANRNLRYSDIKTIPDGELAALLAGRPLYN